VIRLFGRFYNERRPHSGLKYMTPKEFYELWKKEHGGGVVLGLCPNVEPSAPLPQDLSHCASSGCEVEKSGPTVSNDRPDNHRMIHVGAPVASQQSRILRVDEKSISQTKAAGTFPAKNHNIGLTS
jgi:hypothetical protein